MLPHYLTVMYPTEMHLCCLLSFRSLSKKFTLDFQSPIQTYHFLILLESLIMPSECSYNFQDVIAWMQLLNFSSVTDCFFISFILFYSSVKSISFYVEFQHGLSGCNFICFPSGVNYYKLLIVYLDWFPALVYTF